MQLSEPLSSSHSALFQAVVAFILANISKCHQNFLNLQERCRFLSCLTAVVITPAR